MRHLQADQAVEAGIQAQRVGKRKKVVSQLISQARPAELPYGDGDIPINGQFLSFFLFFLAVAPPRCTAGLRLTGPAACAARPPCVRGLTCACPACWGVSGLFRLPSALQAGLCRAPRQGGEPPARQLSECARPVLKQLFAPPVAMPLVCFSAGPCKADVRKFCRGVEPGEGALAACLLGQAQVGCLLCHQAQAAANGPSVCMGLPHRLQAAEDGHALPGQRSACSLPLSRLHAAAAKTRSSCFRLIFNC